jgi:hypothetical protein
VQMKIFIGKLIFLLGGDPGRSWAQYNKKEPTTLQGWLSLGATSSDTLELYSRVRPPTGEKESHPFARPRMSQTVKERRFRLNQRGHQSPITGVLD